MKRIILIIISMINFLNANLLIDLKYEGNKKYILKTKKEFNKFLNKKIKYIYVDSKKEVGEFELKEKKYSKTQPKESIYPTKKYKTEILKFHDEKMIIYPLIKNKRMEEIKKSDIKTIKNFFNKVSIKETEWLKDKINKKIKKNNIKDKYLSIISLKKQTFYVLKKINDKYTILFKDYISTGRGNVYSKTTQKRYFKTPTGIFERTKYIKGDWYGLGTDAKGYGDYGSKVFYLGTKLDKEGHPFHFAIHSTNSVREYYLGKPLSQGCIRISKKLNYYLKTSHILNGKKGNHIIIFD